MHDSNSFIFEVFFWKPNNHVEQKYFCRVQKYFWEMFNVFRKLKNILGLGRNIFCSRWLFEGIRTSKMTSKMKELEPCSVFFSRKILGNFPKFWWLKKYWANFGETIYPILPIFERQLVKFQRQNVI